MADSDTKPSASQQSDPTIPETTLPWCNNCNKHVSLETSPSMADNNLVCSYCRNASVQSPSSDSEHRGDQEGDSEFPADGSSIHPLADDRVPRVEHSREDRLRIQDHELMDALGDEIPMIDAINSLHGEVPGVDEEDWWLELEGSQPIPRIARIFEWSEILPYLENDADDSEYEAWMQNSAENDNGGRRGAPPASKKVVAKLLKEKVEVEEEVVPCAVCTDSVGVGEIVTKLPCSHGYHGDCIVPWLGARNSCPVCRFELQTDDRDYEEKKKKKKMRLS